jgi:hypothetical protein
MEALADFAPKMPPDVFQTGPYLARVPNESTRVHPGDVIVAEPKRPTDVGGRFMVWPNGNFDFPFCGITFVGRKTVDEATKTLEDCFAHGVRKTETPGVTLGALSRTHVEPLDAAVGGAVPIGMIVPGGTTIDEALEKAGATSNQASSSKIFRAGGAIAPNELPGGKLAPGDLLLVGR